MDHPFRFGAESVGAPLSLQVLADRLTEAKFHFERSGGVLTVRDNWGGRVEFQSGDDGENNYRADCYGARRRLVMNLVSCLQVYGLTAYFHFVYPSLADKVAKHRITRMPGSQTFLIPLGGKGKARA